MGVRRHRQVEALAPSGNVVKCFCALVVTAKRSVDELFMHYFHNLSSAQTPTRIHPWTPLPLGDFRSHTPNFPTPGKNTACGVRPWSSCRYTAMLSQLKNIHAKMNKESCWQSLNVNRLRIYNQVIHICPITANSTRVRIAGHQLNSSTYYRISLGVCYASVVRPFFTRNQACRRTFWQSLFHRSFLRNVRRRFLNRHGGTMCCWCVIDCIIRHLIANLAARRCNVYRNSTRQNHVHRRRRLLPPVTITSNT